MAGKRPSKKAKPAEPPAPQTRAARPSALLDTRITYCGDCPSQLSSEPRPSGSGFLAAFEDRHAGTEAYIDHERPRRVELARVLKKTGSTRSRIAGLRRLSPAYVTYLPACVRYVEMDPVRAGLWRRPEKYPWSSAAAHVSGQDAVLMQAGRLLDLVPSWAEHLSAAADEEMIRRLRRHETTGRPVGGERFLIRLEKIVGRLLRPRKAGRKKKAGKK